MDSLNAISSRIKLEGLTLKATEVLNRLQQAGVFRAIVLQRQGNQVLLDTAFGRLNGKAPDTLNRGDEILARLMPNHQQPTVKVIQHAPRVLTVSAQSLQEQLKADTPLPILARVTASNKQHTQLQIAGKTISIPRQNLLQPGERILIQPHTDNQLRLVRIQPQIILKAALSSLLPRGTQKTPEVSLSTLQNLTSALLKGDPAMLGERLSQRLAEMSRPQSSPTDKVALGHQPAEANTKTAIKDDSKFFEAPIKNAQIKPLIARLATPLANMPGLNAQSLQQALAVLSLIRPSSFFPQAAATQPLPTVMLTLMQALQDSPDSLQPLVREALAQQSATAGNSATLDRALIDISQGLRSELLQQTEQALNQLLTQKTTLSLQLEQSQPIQVNLNLPIQVDQEIRQLTLKIREKNKQDADSEQHWELSLAFEFGELGLISTNILLQDKRLSAHFWATRASTKTLIDTHMDQFKAQLEHSGFELGLFDCFLGQPRGVKDTDDPLPFVDNLLDVKA